MASLIASFMRGEVYEAWTVMRLRYQRHCTVPLTLTLTLILTGRAEEDARVGGGRQQRGVGLGSPRVGGGECGERREHALVEDLLERGAVRDEVGVEQPVPG